MKFVALLLLFSAYSHGESYTLEQALQVATQNSPAIQRAESHRDESYWKKVESYSAFLPTISGSINYLPTYKYLITDIAIPGFPGGPVAIPGIVPTTIYGLQAQYNLFDGLASTRRLQSSWLTEKAASEELDWTSFQTSRQVTLQFYRALASKILKEVADSNLKTLEDHLHDVNLLKKSGLGTNYDVLRVEVQVSEATSEVLNTADDIETATGHLGELLGKDSAAEPQGKLPEPPADLLDRANIKSQRADLASMQDQMDALNDQRRAAAGHWMPRISLVGQYQYYNNLSDAPADWSNFRDAYEFGLNLTWNLFEGFNSEAKKRELQEQTVQLEKSLTSARLKAQQDVALWKRKYKYFCSVFKARQSDIGKAKEAVRLAKEGRRVGSRTNTDLLDAETDLFRSQAGAVNAQIGVIEALINLELATGQKLYEFN